jgi:hypothetical protein
MKMLRKGNGAMNDRKYRVQVTFFLAVAAMIVCFVALPVFGQDAASPSQSAQQNATPAPAHPNSPPNVHHAAATAASSYSPQSPVAPRRTIDTLAEIKKRGKLRVGVSMIVP